MTIEEIITIEEIKEKGKKIEETPNRSLYSYKEVFYIHLPKDNKIIRTNKYKIIIDKTLRFIDYNSGKIRMIKENGYELKLFGEEEL
jgi:hypothetical protein